MNTSDVALLFIFLVIAHAVLSHIWWTWGYQTGYDAGRRAVLDRLQSQRDEALRLRREIEEMPQ